MDLMAQQMQEQAQQQQQPQQGQPQQDGMPPVPQNAAPIEFPKVDSKVLKLATVAMLFKKMNQDKVQTILNKFEPDDAESVIKYMQIPNLAERVGTANALRCLQEIKMNLPKGTELSPNRVVNKIKKAVSKYSGKEIDTLLIRERIGVKRLVFNALEGQYYDKIPPKVASIVATHLSDSV